MIELSGKVVLVTGASGGIGAGITRCFQQAGAKVVAHGFSKAPEEGDYVVRGDLRTDAARIVEEAFAQEGRLDGLINNAGILHEVPLVDMDVADWQRMLDANLTTAFACTQAAVRLMREGGSITHISSVEAHSPSALHAHYSVAKAALNMHARAAALEFGELGVRVNTVSPGLIIRPGIEEQFPEGVARWNEIAPLSRLGTPEDIGNACVFLASDLASWITGQDLAVDGGVTARPTW